MIRAIQGDAVTCDTKPIYFQLKEIQEYVSVIFVLKKEIRILREKLTC